MRAFPTVIATHFAPPFAKNIVSMQNTGTAEVNLGDSYIECRLSEKTKKIYKSKVAQFTLWIKWKHPALYHTGRNEVNFRDLTAAVLKDFIGDVSLKRNKKLETAANPFVFAVPHKQQSFEHVSGYKSAVINEYKARSIGVPDEVTMMFSQLFAGYKRKVGEMKLNGEMPMQEGKQPITFDGVNFIAKESMKHTTDFGLHLFGHIFLLLCWNLISRSISVSSLMFDHISWSGDAMVMVFPTHKGDKEGKNCSPKHVYANPSNPAVCPILWLAVYIFCSGARRADSRRSVFGETDGAESRFSKWLRAMFAAHSAVLENMGLFIEWLGTHSFRKGVATFLAGMCGGPGPIPIYLRAGWSLGPVTSRYILEGGGGDHLCGRAATGLPITDTAFAALPPHFDLPDGAVLTQEEWENVLPGYTTFYPQCFKQVVPFLLASLIFHRAYLTAELPAAHPLFSSRAWTCGIMTREAHRVHTGVGHNPVSGLTATGIPPHIVLANEVCGLKAEVGHLREELIKRLEHMPESISSHMREQFTIEGAVQVTRSDVQLLMAEMETRVLAAFGSMAQSVQSGVSNSTPVTSNTDVSASYASFTWGNPRRMHNVPEGFKFPR